MKYLISSFLIIFCINTSFAQWEKLDDFKWKKRLLIIYTNEYTQALLESQIQNIKGELKEYQERDLLVLILEEESVNILDDNHSHSLDYLKVMNRLNISSEDGYQNLLIGKDGGIKLRKENLISNKELFNIIDAMPMRKREMKTEN
jgi:hypothetical protein